MNGLTVEHDGATAALEPMGFRASEPAPVVRPVDGRLTSLVAPTSLEAEQYHVLRQLIDRRQQGRHSIIGVTSPGPGDGKTTTAVNLAGALAQRPSTRVLLVDGDLRRPTIHSRLGLADSFGPGFAGAIADQALDLNSVVRRLLPYNLFVLPAGRCTGLSFEMLHSARARYLMRQAREQFDYVVLDTPPVLLLPDTRSVSHWTSGFLLVVSAHRTPRKLVEEALNTLEPSKVIGIVFNGDDRPLGGYYKHYNSYYYGRPANGHGPGWRRKVRRWGRALMGGDGGGD